MVCEKINWWQASWQFATITFVWSADATVLFPANQILLSLLCKATSCSCCWHAEGRPRNSNNSTTSFHLYGHILSQNTPWRQPQHSTAKMWPSAWSLHDVEIQLCQPPPWIQYKSLPHQRSQLLRDNCGLYLHLDWSHLALLSIPHLKLCLIELPLGQGKGTDICRFPNRLGCLRFERQGG